GSSTDAGPGTDAGSSNDAGSSTGTTDETIASVLARFPANGDQPAELEEPLVVRDVYVGYVREKGFTVQQNPSGPALYVYTATTPTVAPGNKIDLEVKGLFNFEGLPEVDDYSILANDNGNYDVSSNLSQDLGAGAGTSVGASLLAELVQVSAATVVGGSSRDWSLRFGTADVTASLYAYAASEVGLCPGATLDVANAYVTVSSGAYSIATYYAADFENVDLAGCQSSNATSDNWDLEDWSTSDPPPGFIKDDAMFTFTQETVVVEPSIGGTSSGKLVFTDGAQDLVTAYATPFVAPQRATCAIRYFDNDPNGRIRMAIRYVDANGGTVGGPKYFDTYSTDGSTWQALSVTDGATPPEGSVAFRCQLRMYEVGTWAANTSATVYVDNFSASAQ
ncbi:MAG: hypothetical protein ACO3JL_21405, partial [Myxococcota bacterium]